MKYNPVGNKVLVKRIEEEEKTNSGIFLAKNTQREVAHALVLGVGGEVKIDVKEGQIVAFDAMRGYKLQNGSEELLLLLDHEILATIKE